MHGSCYVSHEHRKYAQGELLGRTEHLSGSPAAASSMASASSLIIACPILSSSSSSLLCSSGCVVAAVLAQALACWEFTCRHCCQGPRARCQTDTLRLYDAGARAWGGRCDVTRVELVSAATSSRDSNLPALRALILTVQVVNTDGLLKHRMKQNSHS